MANRQDSPERRRRRTVHRYAARPDDSLDMIEAALRMLGKQLSVEVEEAA